MQAPTTTLKRYLAAAAFIITTAAPFATFAAATIAPDALVQIDTSASAGSVVAQSDYATLSGVSYPADNLFDGDITAANARWLALTSNNPIYFVFHFNSPQKVNALRFFIPGEWNWELRSPKNYAFYGSADGENWGDPLLSRTGEKWSKGETKTVKFDNEAAYEYYKFECTEILGSNDYLMLWEMQFLYSGAPMQDLTSPSGTVTTTTTGSWVSPAAGAFDNGTAHTTADRSIHSGSEVDWIYTFDEPTKVNAYKVYAPGSSVANYEKRMPMTWKFQAKNAADADWTDLDEQLSETGWTAEECRYYAFNNLTAYTSYRFAVTAHQDHGTADDYVQIDELEFFYISQGDPEIGDFSLTRTGAETYSLMAEESANDASVSWIANNGTEAVTNGTQNVAEGGTANWTISGLTSDKTYRVSIFAENAIGTDEKIAGIFYAGALSLGEATNANEKNLVQGGVEVSRASADPFPLVVNYTISGSAGSEGTTWEAPVAVTIPANETTATLPVVPLMDAAVNADATLTVALAPGNYEIPVNGSVNLTLVNLYVPNGSNVWVATSISDGLASTASNWSAGRAPIETDNILLGTWSSQSMTWDSVATVASWTQNSEYAGTVTFPITYEGADGDVGFNMFTVTGDVSLNGGHWVHPVQGNSSKTATEPAEKYRLNIAVGGDMAIASGVNVSAQGRGRGFWTNGETNSWYRRAAHAGYVITNITARFDDEANSLFQPYGTILSPVATGRGVSSGTDPSASNGHGGGAIRLSVAGTLNNNGGILANGQTATQKTGGSGGSIWVSADAITGNGIFKANATTASGSGMSAASSGGRVALYAAGSNSATATTATANGSRSPDQWQVDNQPYWEGAAGTVWLQSATDKTLLVRNSCTFSTVEYASYIRAYTPIPAADDPATFKAAVKDAMLYIASNGRVRLESNLAFQALKVRTESGSLAYLDLHGHTLRVESIVDTGNNELVANGTYTADNPPPGWAGLEDAVGGGTLVVGKTKPTVITLK